MCRIGKWQIGWKQIYGDRFYWKSGVFEDGRLYYKYRILWLVMERDV